MPKPLILFVCTGNICRSPMAEVLCREAVRGRHDWDVASAGTAAVRGMGASAPALAAVRERGLDLSAHASRPLSADLVNQAYIIPVMTRAHRDQLLREFPAGADKVYLLSSFASGADRDSDIRDPIGLPIEVYREVLEEIDAAIPGLVRFVEDNLGA